MKTNEHDNKPEMKKEEAPHDKLLLRGLYFLLIGNFLSMADNFESLPNALVVVLLLTGIGFNIASVVTLVISLRVKKEAKKTSKDT